MVRISRTLRPFKCGFPSGFLQGFFSVVLNVASAKEFCDGLVAMAKLISKMFEPMWNWASRRYTAAVGSKLRSYGLRYDDLYDDMHDLDVKEALTRLPQSIVDERNQRLKRAIDLSMKHSHLPHDLQEKQTPFKPYLQDMLKLVKAERKERELLGSEVPYNRSLP